MTRHYTCRQCGYQTENTELRRETDNPFPTICPRCGSVNLMEDTRSREIKQAV